MEIPVNPANRPEPTDEYSAREPSVPEPAAPSVVSGERAEPPENPVAVLPSGPAPVPAPSQPAGGFWHSRLRWFIILLVVIGIIAVLCASAYLALEDETRGVTVVRMEGTMVTGDYSDNEVIGSEVVGRELRQAADDPLVEAIVLRVNSPGGTPAAAQEIIGDLEYAKHKKPVFVSMGDMGTSAAYYVSAHADRIYANPDTFTAGIGVIWKFSDISRWMEREGYNVSVIKSGSKKDMGSEERPISVEEEEYAMKIVDDSFENFIADIMAQRSIIRSDIEDGRVIRGADAVRMNLVDELGNLNDAIEGAKQMAASRR